MLADVACRERSNDGLSEDELLVATGIIYSRFRGYFKDVTRESSPQDQAELVIWGPQDSGPLFRVCKLDGRFIAIDEPADRIDISDRLESLLEAIRHRYPRMSVL